MRGNKSRSEINLDSQNSMLLVRNQFSFNALIRVMKVELFKFNVRKSFSEINPTVVAQNLRLPNRVGHHLTRKGIVCHQGLGQALLQNPDPGGGHRGAAVVLVAEEHSHIDWWQKQVKVGEW